MGNLNFTKKALESLPIPEKNSTRYRDTGTSGLGIKIEPSGTRTFFWRRKVRREDQWLTIGDFPEISLEDARAKASSYNSARTEWKRNGWVGPSPFERADSSTLGEIVEMYVKEHIREHAANPEKAAKNIKWQMDRYASDWRSKKVREIIRTIRCPATCPSRDQ